MSKKHMLGVPSFAIATIAIILDPDIGHHNEAWINHQ
jgi:hypothetical protein